MTDTTDTMSVADLLTRSLRIVYASLSLRRAAEAMTEDGIGLLVVDARRRPIGVVSARDVMRAFVACSLSTDEVVTS